MTDLSRPDGAEDTDDAAWIAYRDLDVGLAKDSRAGKRRIAFQERASNRLEYEVRRGRMRPSR